MEQIDASHEGDEDLFSALLEEATTDVGHTAIPDFLDLLENEPFFETPWYGNDGFNYNPEDAIHGLFQDEVTAAPLATGADQFGLYSSPLSAPQNSNSFPMDYNILSVDYNRFHGPDSFFTKHVDYPYTCESETMPNNDTHAAQSLIGQSGILATASFSNTNYQNLIEHSDPLPDNVSHSIRSTNLANPSPLYSAEQTPVTGDSGINSKAPGNETISYGPVSILNRPLPKKRRGGRQGSLSEAQKKRRRQAQQDGVCIKCRRNKIQCSGGIPCSSCSKELQPRIWQRPCVKAEFHEIVVAGSYFPYLSAYQALRMKSTKSIISYFLTMCHLGKRDFFIPIKTNKASSPWGVSCYISCLLGIAGLASFLQGSPTVPTTFTAMKIAQAATQITKLDSKCQLVLFGSPRDPVHREKAFSQKLLLCSLAPYSHNVADDSVISQLKVDERENILQNTVELLIFFAVRHCELSLFRTLQTQSNELENDDSEDSHAYIRCILITLLSTGSLTEPMKTHLEIDLKDHIAQCAIGEHGDRVSRVRTALWVYASIAISKLPAWTDFWNKTQDINPILTKDTVRESFLLGVENFETSIHNGAYRPVKDTLERLKDFSEGFKLIKADTRPSEKTEYNPDNMLQFMRGTIITQKHDDPISRLDEISTGGLLLANTKERQRRAAAQRFYLFATIDWTSCFTGKGETKSFYRGMHREVYLNLIQIAKVRSAKMELYELSRRIDREAEVLREECIDWEKLKNFGKSEEFLRSGKRWTEVRDILGQGAIYLEGFLDNVSREDTQSKLNITSVILHGEDDEFERLKHALSTRFQWLSEYCLQIQRILPLIHEAESLRTTDTEKTMSLAKQITEGVAEVFGTREEIFRVGEQLNNDESLLTSVLVLLAEVLDYDMNRSWVQPGQDNERQLIYTILGRELAPILSSSNNKYWVWTDSWAKRAMQQIGEALHRTKQQVLLSYNERADESIKECNESDELESQGGRREVLLSKAFDAFFRLVSDEWLNTDAEFSKKQERPLNQRICEVSDFFKLALE